MRKTVLKTNRTQLFAAIASICTILFLGGCSMNNSERYFENEEEAKKVMLEQLEEKYDKQFTLTNEYSYEFEETSGCYIFRAKFQDENGLEADAILPQTKSMIQRMKDSGGHLANRDKDDTYSDVFYTKKAIAELEPLFEGEPFEKYIISLNNSGYAGSDLSLSLDEFFAGSDVSYFLEVVLADGKDQEEYTKTIYNLCQKLVKEQSHKFSLSAYANGVRIFMVSYNHAKHYDGKLSYKDVESKVTMDSNDPIPDDEWMVWDYYIKASKSWL